MWRATVLTLFPEMFPGPLGILARGDAFQHRDQMILRHPRARDFKLPRAVLCR